MIAVGIPTTDVNSETAELIKWYVADRAAVSEEQPLAEVETSKAILDITAPADGFVLHDARVGDQLSLAEPLAFVFASVEELERHVADAQVAVAPSSAERVTEPARRRAAELDVDLDLLLRRSGDLITTAVVEAAADPSPDSEQPLPEPLAAPPGIRRIALIGAGLGATQVLDILRGDEEQRTIAIVDDDPKLWGITVADTPVIGGVQRLLALRAQDAVDAAIIAVGTSVPARVRLREICRQAGLPLANAIDRTARIATGVQFGSGNIVCAFCHFGVGTTVGDNNFISAYNSFDHHSVIGSNIATGPGCMTSGVVKIGDRCRLGTGIFIEPHVELGEGVRVASGATIVASVPPDHTVKTRHTTTVVVPNRQ